MSMTLYGALALHAIATVLLVGCAAYVARSGLPGACRTFTLAAATTAVAATVGGVYLAIPILNASPLLTEFVASTRNALVGLAALTWAAFLLDRSRIDLGMSRRRTSGVAAVAGGAAVLTATNPLHGLTYTAVEPSEWPGGTVYAAEHGLLSPFLLTAGLFIVVTAAAVTLGRSLRADVELDRATAALAGSLLVAAFGVTAANLGATVPLTVVSIPLIASAVYVAVAADAFNTSTSDDSGDSIAADAVTDPILVVGDDGELVDHNPAAEEEFAANRLDDIAANITNAHDTTDDETVTGRAQFTVDGEERTYRVTTTDYDDATLLHLTDVTALHDRIEELEVEFDRLDDFSDAVMEGYQRDLRRQTEHLEEIASTVNHDVRNPLQVAQTYVARLASQEDDAEKARRALDRVEQLIDNAVVLARQGKVIEETEQVDFEEQIRLSWVVTDTQRADLDVAFSEGTNIEADKERLSTLLENLYRNASRHGGSEVTIRVGLLDDLDGFYVEDDGPGIPESERERVFEKGYTTSDEGTGFGLAIVERIASAHDWEVEVAEGTDGGARFEFVGADVVPGHLDGGSDAGENAASEPDSTAD